MPFLNDENRQQFGGETIALSQRSRAGVEFLGSLQKYSSSVVRAKALNDFTSDPDSAAIEKNWNDETTNEPWELKLDRAREVAERSPNYLFERLFQRYVAEGVYIRGIPAVEENRAQHVANISDMGPDVGGSLELNPDLDIPEYYAGVDWHLEPDGWDGYDLYGPMFSTVAMPHIFKHGGYAAVSPGDDIVKQRQSYARQLPKSDYERIYEFGCGGIATLANIHEAFPNAELIGCDLSPLALRMGHMTANRIGVPIHFRQRNACETGEEDASVDAVLSYALMHEMPTSVAVEMLKEAFRILKPGGDILISDPPPFFAVDPFQGVILDWDTEHRKEPFFTEACSTDWREILKDVGFENAEAYAIGDNGYPWINRASKPK